MKLLIKWPVLALFAVLTFSSCSTDSLDDQANAIELNLVTPEVKDIEVEILNLINDHRLSKGLNPLGDMTLVKSVAFTHTDYMVDKDEVSHANFYTRSNYLKANAGAKRVSENVAYGYSTAQGVVNAWIKSESHRENLEGDFTNFDVSAEKNENGRWYYTNIFIKK
ncbi:CAP domain-containing protein [Sabulilitoribacter multivorans]|uniref:CAP domain-containing protein n=1 Tax=Flaviramulus multivorans TaxID=1304750 RepID=A0ABS9IGT1_9FLAO|nr:CAP domain-containing protein [Flaviramulus multivorans]MCF7559966.1 CAP domain-containing protein [Flaviramulus multivorans]